MYIAASTSKVPLFRFILPIYQGRFIGRVDIFFIGYSGSAQMACLSLMAKKISVIQSTSDDMLDTGFNVLIQDGDSLEVALAKQ